MSISSVQLYLKNQLQGLALPTTPAQNLTAIVTPNQPVMKDTFPRAFIWGSTGNEGRQTMPRAKPGQPSTGGFKTLVHHVDIWIVWFGVSSDPNADSQFPSVMEAIMQQLRTTTMPVLNLLDTTTGRLSDLLMVGEDMKWDYAPVHSLIPQRNIYRYDGRIIVDVKEKIQA